MFNELCKKIFLSITSRFLLQFRHLRDAEKKFIKMNSAFWVQYNHGKKVSKSEYLLIRPEQYPLILIGLAQIGSFAALEKNLSLLFFIPSRFDRSMRKVLNSFPRCTFIFGDNLRYLFFKFYSFLQALRAMKFFKKPEDVLNFKTDGILVGDLIYDSFLRINESATMDNVNSDAFLYTLQGFFYQRNVIRDVIKRYRIKMGLTAHVIGIGGGVFLRYLLDNHIEVWEKADTLKKYNSIDEIHECWMNPDKRYINFMKKNIDYFIPAAEKCLKDRLENRNLIVKLRLPYRSDKKIFYTVQEFSHSFNLDPDKKNIFVMLHAFNDFPNTFGFMIYRDFYEWFKVVLEIVQRTDSVNWIFKEHPYAKHYPTRDLNLETVFAKITAKNILFLNADADFNTSSLRYIADATLTCIGTAGLEYSAYGIPCVLGAKSSYSGFGFTIEPQTDTEFKKILQNIDSLPRLNSEQIKIAKILSFFTFELIDPTKFPDPFGIIPTQNFVDQELFSADRIFECIVAQREKSASQEKNEFIESINEFISNPRYTQYINLDKYSLFREIFANFKTSRVKNGYSQVKNSVFNV